MPLYRTDPGVTLDDLVAILESRGEEILSLQRQHDEGWLVVTKPMLRIVTNFGTETR